MTFFFDRLWLLACLVSLPLVAGEPAVTIRELLVPQADLPVIFASDPNRVMLPREEFEGLDELARRSAPAAPPAAMLFTGADYRIVATGERAVISGRLTLSVLTDGVHRLPLPIGDGGLQTALLDGQPASVGRDADGACHLFVSGKGRRVLELQAIATIETTAARQILTFELPLVPAATMRMTATGNVDLKSGGAVVDRRYDEEADETHFQILPASGPQRLVLTLNNRLLRQDRVVVVRQVLVSEITQADERLHGTVALDILHRATASFRFRLPADFEVTSVRSADLSQWLVEAAADGDELVVHLRGERTGRVQLSMVARRQTPPTLTDWHFPQLRPVDASAVISIVGVLLEDRLALATTAVDGLIPIGNEVLTRALPDTLAVAEPGRPPLRPMLAHYAPGADFMLAASFEKPAARLRVTANSVLRVSREGLELRGGMVLLPEHEKQFALDIESPADWEMLQVALQDGADLPIERYRQANGGTRFHVRIAGGLPPGQPQNLVFAARLLPSEWLTDWRERTIDFPHFRIRHAVVEKGAIAVRADDDLEVIPGIMTGLTPLNEHEKPEYGLEGIPTTLAYRYRETDYTAEIHLRSKNARLRGEAFSFYRLTGDALHTRMEVVFEIDQAACDSFHILLPLETPESVAMSGLDGTTVRRFSAASLPEGRLWTVDLAQPARGTAIIAIDFQQPLPASDTFELNLPLPRIEEVIYQSGKLTVEGGAELDIDILNPPRPVDIGELVEANYQTGRRLLGAFSYVGQPPSVALRVHRPTAFALPATIVERLACATVLSADGIAQTAARYRLHTKTAYIEIELPDEASLWSVMLNGRPSRPQRDAGRILVDLSTGESDLTRDLTIVYEHPIKPLGPLATVVLQPPRLLFPGTAKDNSLPTVMLDWQVFPPTGYQLLHAGGGVASQAHPQPELAVSALFRTLARVGGGVRFGRGLLGGCLRGLQCVSQAPRARSKLDGRASYEYADFDEADAFGDWDQLDEADDRLFKPSLEAAPAPASPRLPVRPAPPVPEEEGKTGRDVSSPRAVKSPVWAMEGVRSLTIELSRQGPGIALHSLGENPRATLGFANRRRWQALRWAVFALVLLGGGRHLSASWRRRLPYIAIVLGGASVLPAVPPLAVATGICNAAFYAGACLLLLYPLADLGRRIFCGFRQARQRLIGRRLRIVGAGLTVVLAMFSASGGWAATPGRTAVVVEGQPVSDLVVVPSEALIVPYTLADDGSFQESGTILVPRPLFERLHRLAYPDAHPPAPPAPFAYDGLELTATLDDDDDNLALRGILRLTVFADGPVQVPLPLDNAVLEQARIAGQAADLSIVPSAPEPTTAQAGKPEAGQPLIVLNLGGAGVYELAVSFRVGLTRQGGWRIARAMLPPIPVNRLLLTVPASETELRLPGTTEDETIETRRPNQTVETGLATDGGFNLQWRPRVARAQVDRTLTSAATAVVDVREDRLHAVWQFDLAFRHGERERFAIVIPDDYVVEDIEGDNIRGWTRGHDGDGQRLDIALLKPAREKETFVVHLWHPMAGVASEPGLVAIPAVAVDGAIRQTGRLLIRRSPTLELHPRAWQGWRRIDLAPTTLEPKGQSPLGVDPFQALEFVAFPEPLTLMVSRQQAVVRVVNQTILRIAERERRFETRLLLDIGQRPLHRLAIDLSGDCQDLSVSSSATFEWAIGDQANGRRLELFFSEGVVGQATVLVSGRLGPVGPADMVSLPNVIVPSAIGQQGEVVVQADPVFDVEAGDLADVQAIPISRCHRWLTPAQRPSARLALHHREPSYGGMIAWRRRQPAIRAFSATNVRVTDRAVEETILLTFNIQSAGVQRVEFRLPGYLAEARISAPLLRRRQVTPVDADDEVHVVIELQDEVMRELRVLIEHDRGLTGDEVVVVPPRILTGTVDRQYLALQDAGRDEVVVGATPELEPLNRQHQEWRRVANLFAGETRAAFVVVPDAHQPKLTFVTRQRSEVQTAGGRIGLARTVLWLDFHGAYRASQSYQVDNRTEQFLHLTLPPGARIWTASVAGERVKPFLPNAGHSGHVRIPLVKTAAGDLDYEVVLKYGGTVPPPGPFRRVEFPFIQTENIRVEQSQVEVHLPRGRRWYGFDGTLGQIATQADFQVGFLDYQNRLAKRLLQSAQYGSSFEKARADKNYRHLQRVLSQSTRLSSGELAANQELRHKISETQSLIADADRQLERERAQQAEQTAWATDNRAQMNAAFANQSNDLARDKVLAHGLNWEAAAQPPADAPATQPQSAADFKRGWLDASGLIVVAGEQSKKEMAAQSDRIRELGDARLKANQALDMLQLDLSGQVAGERPAPSQRRAGGERQILVEEYRRRLQAEDDAPPPASRMAFDPAGGLVGLAGQDGTPVAAGMASLDVALPPVDPRYWVTYRFSTPRGEVALQARSIAETSLAAWRKLGLAALTIGALLALAAATRHRRPTFAAKPAAKHLAAIGLIGLLAGIFPVYAFILLLVGMGWRLAAGRPQSGLP